MTEITTKPAAKKATSSKPAADGKAAGAKGNPERNKAYQAATGTLRNNHRNEFEDLLRAECEARGVKYRRRLTDEEKAARELESIYAKYPHLRPSELDEQVRNEVGPGGEPI